MLTQIVKKDNCVYIEIPKEIAKLYEIKPGQKIPLRVNEKENAIVFCASVQK